ncbi:hypothetical protein [Cytobacillus kochii]|uniref:hypothetical protein n=1 Tax=Cytobacillus kochii TaxID=859143 RepID=UPI00402AD33A
MYCIYNENVISCGLSYHHRQFKEDRAGKMYPIFRDNVAVLKINDEDHYIIESIDGEILFVGIGYREGIGRILYADSEAEIQVLHGGKTYKVKEWEAKMCEKESEGLT